MVLEPILKLPDYPGIVSKILPGILKLDTQHEDGYGMGGLYHRTCMPAYNPTCSPFDPGRNMGKRGSRNPEKWAFGVTQKATPLPETIVRRKTSHTIPICVALGGPEVK